LPSYALPAIRRKIGPDSSFLSPEEDRPMPYDQDTLESVSGDLAEARAKIDAARAALQSLLNDQEGDLAPVREAMTRLDRMAAELERIEGVCGVQMIGMENAVR
jgi:hypothetical protein